MNRSVAAPGGRRIISVCTVGVAVLMLCPFTAAATTERAVAAAAGVVYGGQTAQGLPVVLETSRNGRKVKALAAIRLSCTSGSGGTLPDSWAPMTVSKARKFGLSFGPETQRNSDGTTSDFEGSISGAFNKARTKASGTWSLKMTVHDASGAVADTCDSGSVSWSAKQ